MSKGNRLEIEQHLHFCACRRDCSLPCALAAPCLLIRRDWGSDQLQTVFLSSSSFHFQKLFPLKESGAKKHRIAGVQKESNFPRPFGVLSARNQFRVSCLENGSVCSHWQKERGAAALLSGQRAYTQHGRRPLPEVQTLPQHRGQREWAGSL